MRTPACSDSKQLMVFPRRMVERSFNHPLISAEENIIAEHAVCLIRLHCLFGSPDADEIFCTPSELMLGATYVVDADKNKRSLVWTG
ncbi:hypothetical protein NC651_025176 [Populus alba x Populus x berolinensis]|nr:hypothetical protein NC651_025176 [Populus alba x Populus x berolinensis]